MIPTQAQQKPPFNRKAVFILGNNFPSCWKSAALRPLVCRSVALELPPSVFTKQASFGNAI